EPDAAGREPELDGAERIESHPRADLRVDAHDEGSPELDVGGEPSAERSDAPAGECAHDEGRRERRGAIRLIAGRDLTLADRRATLGSLRGGLGAFDRLGLGAR